MAVDTCTAEGYALPPDTDRRANVVHIVYVRNDTDGDMATDLESAHLGRYPLDSHTARRGESEMGVVGGANRSRHRRRRRSIARRS